MIFQFFKIGVTLDTGFLIVLLFSKNFRSQKNLDIWMV